MEKTGVSDKTYNQFVIDGNNICYLNQLSPPSLAPLLNILLKILENNDKFYCVFDANIKHRLPEIEAPIVEDLLRTYPKYFFRVTGSTKADPVILCYADLKQCDIISNDAYRDYVNEYQWLEDKYTKRLIKGNLFDGNQVIFDELPYGKFKVSEDILKTHEELKRLMTNKNSSEIKEVDQEVKVMEEREGICEIINYYSPDSILMPESNYSAPTINTVKQNVVYPKWIPETALSSSESSSSETSFLAVAGAVIAGAAVLYAGYSILSDGEDTVIFDFNDTL